MTGLGSKSEMQLGKYILYENMVCVRGEAWWLIIVMQKTKLMGKEDWLSQSCPRD